MLHVALRLCIVAAYVTARVGVTAVSVVACGYAVAVGADPDGDVGGIVDNGVIWIDVDSGVGVVDDVSDGIGGNGVGGVGCDGIDVVMVGVADVCVGEHGAVVGVVSGVAIGCYGVSDAEVADVCCGV